MARKRPNGNGDPKKKKTAAKKPTPRPKAGDIVKFTPAQAAAFKKRKNIDIRRTAGGNIIGKGAPTPKKTTKPRRR